MTKQKGLKAIIISLLIMLSTTCFSLLYTNIYKTFTAPQSQAALSSGYYITDEIALLEINYTQYSTFYIADEPYAHTYSVDDSFNTFLDFCGRATISLDGDTFQPNPYFAGKTVILCGNVSTSSKPCIEFNGTFNGDGYTISYNNEERCEIGNGDFGRFVNELGENGIIKNLHITGSYLYLNSAYTTRGAAIVGVNNGTIDSCVVSDIKFLSNKYASETWVAPIAVNNNGTIKNCIVKDNYSIGGNDTNTIFGNSDGLYAHYFVVEGTNPTNSIFVAEVTKTNTIDRTFSPSDTNGADGDRKNAADVLGANNFNTYEAAYNGIDNTNGEWYQYPDGYYYEKADETIYLEIFISWTTLYFDTNNSTDYYEQQVRIPLDHKSTIVNSVVNNSRSNPILVYNQSITATSENGKLFQYWSEVSDCHYSAMFETETYTIYFGYVTDGNLNIEPKIEPDKFMIDVNYGDTIFADFNSEYIGLDFDRYRHTITYYVNNVAMVEYDIRNFSGIHGDYFIIDFGSLNTESIVTSGITVPDLSEVTCEIKPKITFKNLEVSFADINGATRQVKVDGSDSTITKTKVTFRASITATLSEDRKKVTYEFYNVNSEKPEKVVVEYIADPIYQIAYYQNYTRELTRNTSLGPTLEQIAIYIQFQNTIGDYTEEPSRTDMFTIPYDIYANPRYTIEYTMPDNGVENKSLTYILNGSTTVTYTIPAIYVLEEDAGKDAGISITDTLVTITPQLQEKYMIVIFKQNNTEIKRTKMDKGTNVSAVVGYDNGWEKETSTIHLSYNKDNAPQTEEFTFEIPRTQYYAGWEQKVQEKDKVVIIYISIKTYGIIFG